MCDLSCQLSFVHRIDLELGRTSAFVNEVSRWWVLSLCIRVRQSYPDEARDINDREQEITKMWKTLTVCRYLTYFLNICAAFWLRQCYVISARSRWC